MVVVWTPCPLEYMERDAEGKVTLTKPIRVEATLNHVGFFASCGDDYSRKDVYAWLNERGMSVQYGNPWDERARNSRFTRPDGSLTRSSRLISIDWVFGFDTPEEAMEFKLRWL